MQALAPIPASRVSGSGGLATPQALSPPLGHRRALRLGQVINPPTPSFLIGTIRIVLPLCRFGVIIMLNNVFKP